MVKVNAGSLAAQASSVSTVVASRVTALNSAKQSLTSFANQAGLEGTAYQNAKSYATGVLGTLIDGMILLSEETEEGVSKLQSLYSDKCGGESLDSDVLTKKIEKDEELLAKIHDLQAHLDKHATFLSHAFDGLEATIKARLKKNKKKLKYLMEFNAASSTVFDGLTEVQDAVSAGLNYVSEGFGNFNGTFDTSGKGLDWTKTIKTGMEKRRDKVSIDKNSLLKEVKKAYKAGKINKQTYQSIKSGLVNSSTAFLKELAKAKLTDKAVETFTKESWEALSKNFQTMQFSGVLAAVNGAELSTAIDVNPAYAEMIRGGSQFVKKGVPVIGAAVDFGLQLKDGEDVGAAVDFGLQLKDGEDVGDAAVKTGGHVAIGIGAAKAGAIIGSAFPVVGTAGGAVVGFAIGVAGSMAFDWLYDNKEQVYNTTKKVISTRKTIDSVVYEGFWR
ncbi:TPA: hypothetical protein U9Q49_000198 [Streptococcus agalactiae]|nr:hypothetical protein [Streptococcus agalactiae]